MHTKVDQFAMLINMLEENCISRHQSCWSASHQSTQASLGRVRDFYAEL